MAVMANCARDHSTLCSISETIRFSVLRFQSVLYQFVAHDFAALFGALAAQDVGEKEQRRAEKYREKQRRRAAQSCHSLAPLSEERMSAV